MNWSYGVTTSPTRAEDLLPATLASLAKSGFDKPHLFVDGDKEVPSELPITLRLPAIRTAGNWLLALLELYIRSPHADRFALFQDDILCCANLRAYLERSLYPEKGYQNLCLYPKNERSAKKGEDGWSLAAQRGKGGQGLVFNRESLIAILQHDKFYTRFKDRKRGHKNVDGSVCDALEQMGFQEWVHHPSLIDHTGAGGLTAMANRPQPEISAFRGEDYDPLKLL